MAYVVCHRDANIPASREGAMAKSAKTKDDEPEVVTICRNRRATHDYEIHDTLECGLVLKGTEVKSLRESSASLDGAYAKIEGNELWLLNSDIPEYSMGNQLNHKPKRPRKKGRVCPPPARPPKHSTGSPRPRGGCNSRSGPPPR